METYISCADTAKQVRAALKAKWPGVKFGVRSKTYSGGASIDVHWTDGPRVEDVDAVAGTFQGAKFNSLEDLKTYHETTITNPDGSTKTVQYGADYVFCSRTESDFETAKAQALDMIRARCVLSPDGLRYGEDWIDNLAGRIVRARDYLKENDLEKAFRRALYREE